MMDDRVIGAGILVGSLLGIGIYFWLVFLSPWTVLVIQVSAFAAVAALLAIVAWIGYTLATTPPPKPIEELEKELEGLQEEIEGGEESRGAEPGKGEEG
ncbi:transcriptional regulator [Candidatus Bathyarchaeota archaeon]|nr:transcriptional regulator [Candidatus Bathyarchaeota archaeon]